MARRRQRRTGMVGLNDTWHHHGCSTCHVFFTDACGDATVDPQCETCTLRRPRGYDSGYMDPAPCCSEARQVTATKTKVAYRLAGPGPWFRCDACARLIPHVHPRRRIAHPCDECDRTEFHLHRSADVTARRP